MGKQRTKEYDFSAFDEAVEPTTKELDFSAFDDAVKKKDLSQPSPTIGESSVIGSSNPLNPATVRMLNNFNFAQQEDPDTYNTVQKQKQDKKKAQSERLSEINQVYDAAQGQGTSQSIRAGLDEVARNSITPSESSGNSVKNMLNRLQGTIPRLNIVAADTWEKVLGKELTKKWYEFEGRDIDQVRNEAYAELDALRQEVLPTLSLTTSIEDGSIKNIAAGMVNAITSLGSSALPAMATGGAGIFTEMTGDALVDFNEAKAKRLGLSVDELYKTNQAEFGIPATIGVLGGSLEAVGLKGIKKMITKDLVGGGFKKAALLFGVNTQKEGVTEWLQTGLEEANRALGEGKSVEEASKQMWNKMKSKDGLESYLQGVAGATGAAGLGRVGRSLTTPKAKTSFNEEVAKVNMLEMDLRNPNIDDNTKSIIADEATNSIGNMANIIEEDEKVDNELTPEQRVEAVQVNTNIEELQTIIDNPNVSENTKKVIQGQIDELNKSAESIIPADLNIVDEDVEQTRQELEDYIEQAEEIAIQHEQLAEVETDPVEREEALDIARNAREVIEKSQTEIDNLKPKEDESKTRERSEVQSSGSLSPEIRSEEPGSSSSSSGNQEVRESQNGENGTSRKEEEVAESNSDKDLLGDKKPDWMRKVNESDLKASKQGYNVDHIRSVEEALVIKEINKRKESRLARAVKEGRITGQEAVEIVESAGFKVPPEIAALPKNKNELILHRAEEDLSALKKVTDKVKKYEASMKRLTDAKNNKEISTAEFNDLKKRFDDVIGESKPKVKEETTDATKIREEQQGDLTEREGTDGQQQGKQENRNNQEATDKGSKGKTSSSDSIREGGKGKIADIKDRRQAIKDRISQKIKVQRSKMSSGFDPSLLSDFVDLGSTYIEEGIVSATDFVKRFREDYRDMGFDDKEITDDEILNDIYNQNVTPEILEEEADRKKRKATQRVLKSEEYSQEFKDAISEETIYYSELPNSITDKEAEAFIDIKGEFGAETAIMDFNNNIGSAVRFSVMQKLIDRFEANGEYLRAAEMAETLYSKATDYGQGIQIFSTFPKLSKRGQVELAKKNETQQRNNFKKKAKKTTDKIAKELKKANKEAAEETVANVKKKIEQATVVSPEGTIKELPMYGSKNKLFTREKYLKAKQKLRGVSMSSFGGLPIDDVINIAGYHIEATGRDFARFSRRMKADLGSKIKPFLKDIYAQTRKQLIEDGYDESLFLTDEEVNTQINEEEGQKFKDKLDKAIQKKDAKEQKVAIKKLQEISKEEGVWGQYSDSAASRLKNMVLTNAEKDISDSPSLEQFTDGLVKNMKAKMAELLPEQPKRKSVPRPDIEIIGDAYKNFEKYKDVWEKTQKEFQDKYADEPEVLQAIDDYFGEILDKPFSDKLIERAVNKGLSEMDKNIADLVVQHYTVLDNARQSLTDKLINDAGLTGSEASSLAKAIEAEFDRIATKKKRQILEKIFSKKERKKPAIKTLEGDLIKMSNLGAFRTDDVVEMYGDKMGWPKLTEENIKEIERLSDIVQNTSDTIKKRRAVEDLLGYQAKIKGNSISDLVTSIWYANVLSGYNTQVVNFGANAINTALLYANAVAQKPKDGLFLAKGLINGMYRGFLEAEETLRTGYSPIKGKAEVPTLLELKRFAGGAKNPLNYLKYVRRVMIAADVLFFEGQKEMRAYQIAKMQASNEGKLDPTLNQMNRAIELVGNSDRQVQAIQEQVELEYEKEVAEIEASDLSASEKKTALKQAASDKGRRVFDMIEQQRSAEIIQETAEYAAEGTYNYKPKGTLGVAAHGINIIAERIPPFRYVVPFTNIIANVANEVINYSPLGYVRRIQADNGGGLLSFAGVNYNREPLTDKQKVLLTTKATIGVVSMAAVFALSQVNGDDDEPYLEITGNGTGDYAKNETLRQTGWEPYSFRFKLPSGEYSGWFSYKYTPLIASLGYVGHYNDLIKYKNDDDNDSIMVKMSKAAGLTSTTIFQASFLGGLGDFLSAVLDERSSEATMDKSIKAMTKAAKGVLIPNLYTQTAQLYESVFDIPKKEIRETYSGILLQDIPYARNMFYDKINILGDPITPDIDKFSSANKPNKIIQLLIDKKAVFAPINRKAEKIYDIEEGKERALTDEEFYEYSKSKGQFIKEALTERYDELSKMSDNDFKKELTSIKKESTKMARYEIMDIDNSMVEIKVEIDNEIKTYELSPDQIKERQKINADFVSKNGDRMKPSLVRKYVNQGLNKLKADKKADLDIQRKANIYSRKKMISNEMRLNDGKVTFKEKE